MVNISTSQTVDAKKQRRRQRTPTGLRIAVASAARTRSFRRISPFNEFFDEFFKNRRADKNAAPRKVNSLGSGFIIDTSGVVVTNNHVIADADEINVILNDGTKIKAELLGNDKIKRPCRSQVYASGG